MKQLSVEAPELSRPLSVDKISTGGMVERIVARPNERKALMVRFGLLDLSRLEADLSIDHARDRMLTVTGSFVADVVQQCVVTLEPIPVRVTDKIDIIFAPPHLLDKGAGSPHFDSGEEEAPEPIVNGEIDLGELVAQHLAVALDPYPRKPDAALPDAACAPEADSPDNVINPFARLAALKDIERK